MRISLFQRSPERFFSEIHFGRRQVEILTNRALHQRFLLGLRARRRRGFPKGPPRGFQENPQTISKVFKSDRFYRLAELILFYRVLLDSKINLDRTGALRWWHFGNFSGRAQPGSAAGRAGWRPAGEASPKKCKTERSCSIEIDFGKFQDSIEFQNARNVTI